MIFTPKNRYRLDWTELNADRITDEFSVFLGIFFNFDIKCQNSRPSNERKYEEEMTMIISPYCIFFSR